MEAGLISCTIPAGPICTVGTEICCDSASGDACCGSTKLNDAGTCRDPVITDVDASCTLGTVVDTGLASCRIAVTTDANANCIVGNLVDTTTNCRVPVTTDVNAACTATAYIGGNVDGSGCRAALTTDASLGCAS
ncbi:MAG: hypothetical protein HRU36_03305, partial [Rickettsiales bacterium]|nr:hypothetical protein [Rickettsiales bacterium]